METKQIIQSSANVIRISKLSKGSIYKRFEKDYEDRTYFGVVTNVYNDGLNTIIEATEYKYSWRSIEANHKVLTGTKDYILFPATLEEIQSEFSRVIEDKKTEIENKKKEISECENTIKFTEKLISGEMQKELHQAEFKEMTQEDYNRKTLELV